MNYSVKAFNAGTFWAPGPEVYWMERWGTREEMTSSSTWSVVAGTISLLISD
jgi:hypothetical protein